MPQNEITAWKKQNKRKLSNAGEKLSKTYRFMLKNEKQKRKTYCITLYRLFNGFKFARKYVLEWFIYLTTHFSVHFKLFSSFYLKRGNFAKILRVIQHDFSFFSFIDIILHVLTNFSPPALVQSFMKYLQYNYRILYKNTAKNLRESDESMKFTLVLHCYFI